LDELFTRITKNLVAHEPPFKGLPFASVSMILRDRKFPSVLLIKRAERRGDPWSGQIAFPGGKMQSGDKTAKDTAVRETLEEVGVDLNSTAEFLGYGAVTTTHTGTMEVVPSAFELREGVDIRPNEEVASYRWVDLHDLLSPGARSSYELNFQGNVVQLPAFTAGDYVVWGLTHRILSSMLKEPG